MNALRDSGNQSVSILDRSFALGQWEGIKKKTARNTKGEDSELNLHPLNFDSGGDAIIVSSGRRDVGHSLHDLALLIVERILHAV